MADPVGLISILEVIMQNSVKTLLALLIFFSGLDITLVDAADKRTRTASDREVGEVVEQRGKRPRQVAEDDAEEAADMAELVAEQAPAPVIAPLYVINPDHAPAMLAVFAQATITALNLGMIDPATGDTALHKLLETDVTGATLTYLCTAHRATIAPFANVTNTSGETPLVKAIISNNQPAFAALLPVTNLQASLTLNGHQTHYAHLACTSQNVAFFAAIITQMLASCMMPAEKTAALNLRDYNGNNIAQVAIIMNATPFLNILVAHPELPVFNINPAGDSILTFTIKLGGHHVACTNVLINDTILKRFPGLVIRPDMEGNTPFHLAARDIKQQSAYLPEPNPELFHTFQELLARANDPAVYALDKLNLRARNHAGKTPLQMIESEDMQEWVISHYKAMPVIADELRKSLVAAPKQMCCVQ